MREWLQDREDERLSKISEKNTLYRPKEPEIVRLHVEEKMGIKAISKHFSGRPSSPGVRAILIRNGVYLGHETYNRQVRASVERRVKHVNDEKERRHRLAVCLMGLRKGCGIETTCKQEGWNKSSIWNTLSQRVSYKKFKVRQKPRWVDKRIYGNAYSRIFLRESLFQSVIEGILKEAGFKFIPQYRISDALTKVDIKMEDGTFVELKVALNSGQSYEFIGQAYHYRKHTGKIVLCIPSDIQFRRDLYDLIMELGVIVCNELTLVRVLHGELPIESEGQVVPQRASRFVCKCCGESGKRRYRSNSYCIECKPGISGMYYDWRTDRWVKS